ncbi:MAG: triose-phosphate isomerase [Rhodospirillaceae bacterium]|nr:triose-phosphate isomerase [Rhodospirillaceae bacterium]
MAARPMPLIAGNWKMNGSRREAIALAESVAARVTREPPQCKVLVCPPATLLHEVAVALRGRAVAVGGQDCHAQSRGAFTGDVSAAMIADAGGTYVIVGHSERRTLHGESDETVKAKAEAAHAAGLVAIICVGETEKERDAGMTLHVLSRQMTGSIPKGATAANTVIAYEPVWAIGTGRTATQAEIAEAHAHIRLGLARHVAESGRAKILYGGSVKGTNALDILAVKDVDGALVGGASLTAEEFCAIIRACPVRQTTPAL